MKGVTPIVRKGGKQVYRIAFQWRGQQCRETVSLAHTRSNETYCERLRGEILRAIELGTFKYGDYFPDSPRAMAFGHGGGRGKTIKDLLESYRNRVVVQFGRQVVTGAQTEKS